MKISAAVLTLVVVVIIECGLHVSARPDRVRFASVPIKSPVAGSPASNPASTPVAPPTAPTAIPPAAQTAVPPPAAPIATPPPDPGPGRLVESLFTTFLRFLQPLLNTSAPHPFINLGSPPAVHSKKRRS